MKIYISYFSMYRFMSAKQICYSTAVSDPLWYHDFAEDKKKVVVKDGKIRGLRHEALVPLHHMCKGMPCQHTPAYCKYLSLYYEQLCKIDFDGFIDSLTQSTELMGHEFGIENPDAVLLVYEAPDNPCSERVALKKWFALHDLSLHEWKKPS